VTLTRPPVLLHILKEHFLELDSLWERRENCIYDSAWNPQELAELEQRAARHLEGLLIGQGHALDLAREALQGDDRGAATAASFVILNLDLPELVEELISTLETADPEVAHGIRIALRHHDISSTEALLRPLAHSESALVRVCVCDVLAFHRRAPVEKLGALLAEDDEEVRALAIAAVGRWRVKWQVENLREQLIQSDSPLVQRAALETSARTKLPELLSVCLDAAFAKGKPSLEALKFLGVVGGGTEIPQLVQALEDPACSRAALSALGTLGFCGTIPSIIAALANPLTVHDAAAAFLRITAADDVQGEPVSPPEEFSEEETDFWDEHVEVDPSLAAQWWQDNEDRFVENERYQKGCAMGDWPPEAGISLEGRRDEFLRACFLETEGFSDQELEAAVNPINP